MKIEKYIQASKIQSQIRSIECELDEVSSEKNLSRVFTDEFFESQRTAKVEYLSQQLSKLKDEFDAL